MNKQTIVVLILFNFLVFGYANSCPSYNGNDLLQSGKNAIMRGAIGGSPQYSYEAPINFMVPSWGMEIAVTTSTIGDYNPIPNYGYNYYIEASRKGTSNNIVYKLIINNDQSWTSMQLSYLACARPDITIGNFEASLNQWVPATSNVYNIYNKISRTLPKANYNVAAFISGFSTTDSQFALTINKKAYDNDKKNLSISFYCSADPAVLTLTITYVIYPDSHPLLDISYNLVPQGDSGSYQISGPVNFQPNKRIQYNEWSVGNRNLACTGNECNNICVLREDCAKNNGNIWQQQCIYCSPGIIFEFGQCSRRCGANQIYVNRVCACANGFTRQGKNCVNIVNKTCGTNQVYSESEKKCVCAKDCFDSNGNYDCLKCPSGSSSSSDGKSCICNAADQLWDAKTNLCKNRCGSNQQWINNKCECVPTHCWYNQQCRQCPSNSSPSADRTTCICKSASAYFAVESNSCVECDAKGNWVLDHDKNKCVCKTGFTNSNGACVANAQCKDNQVLNSKTNKCDCKSGYVKDGNICRPSCATNEIWDGKFCVCADGYARYGTCKKCPNGSKPNSGKTACVCSAANQIFAVSSFSCINCQANASPNADKTSCVCNNGYNTDSKGACVPAVPTCVDPEVLSSDKKSCVCKSGWSKISGKCQPNCQANENWNGNACVCNKGYIKFNGACKQCPSGSQANADSTRCECNNKNQIFSTSSFTCTNCQANSAPNNNRTSCVCSSGYTLTNGACLPTCKDPFVFNPASAKCECKSGYFANGNTCQANCPSGQKWNGTACVCPDKQALYNKTCKVCPSGSLPNSARTACICTDSGSIFQTSSFSCYKCPNNSAPNANFTSCVCKSGFTQTSNGGCQLKCAANQVANLTLGVCQCQFGFYTPANSTKCVARCGNNEQYNGKTCICKPGCGYFNKVCTSCPANSVSNSDRTSCKCKAPNFIFNPSSFKCQVCPAYSTNSQDGTQCICLKGYQKQGNNCLPVCNVNEDLNKTTNQCDCKYGFMRLGPECVQRCGVNQEWTGSDCRCKAGHVKQNNVCKPCPSGLSTNPSRTACLCNDSKKIFDSASFTCINLPANSCANEDFSDYICLPGYKKSGKDCINSCQEGAYPDAAGQCICSGGFYLDTASKTCKKPNSCPSGSTWNQSTLQCICSSSNQYMLNGQCKSCGANSIYSAAQQQCVCNTGFFKIGGQCTTCDARTRYNGTDCVCQLGYFGTRDKCTKCHASCSVCSGPEANQCQACSDVSMVLQKGYCTRTTPCDPGFFLDETNTKSCQKCTDNCIICDDIFECQQCAIGYETQVFQISGQTIYACTEICGDGIKYEAECDDGNKVSGDGCSSECNIQPGWTCVNGSSARKSNCNKFIPDATVLTSMGIVNLGDRVVQSVRASYLPTCLTQNECSNCFKVLTVNVVQANVPILCTVSFVPFSQWQFLVEYNFQGLFVTSKFKTVIKLNEAFKGCLADDDFSQQLELEVDPAFLAKVDQPEELTIAAIAASSSNQVSVPDAAKSILKIN